MSRFERTYGQLLRLYPDEFRARYGAEMARLFAEQVRDAKASQRRFAAASLWVRSVVDLVATAPQQHLRKEHHMPQPVDVAAGALVAEHRRIPDAIPHVALGLIPLWILLVRVFAVPGSMDPIFDNPPGLAGVPAGMFVLGAALIMMAGGAAAVRGTLSSRTRFLAFVCLTVPSAVVVVMAPGLILMLQNA